MSGRVAPVKLVGRKHGSAGSLLLRAEQRSGVCVLSRTDFLRRTKSDRLLIRSSNWVAPTSQIGMRRTKWRGGRYGHCFEDWTICGNGHTFSDSLPSVEA